MIWAPTRSVGDLFFAVSNLSKKDVWTLPFVSFLALTMLADARPKLESPANILKLAVDHPTSLIGLIACVRN